MKPAILAALNAQIEYELSNAQAYQGVASYFGILNLHGFEEFIAHQAKEERMHAEKFIRHVIDRGGQVDLRAVPAPAANFASALDATRAVRDLERDATDKIQCLFDLARTEHDFALEVLLNWYMAEQVEEDEWSGELAALTEQLHERPNQLFMVDHQWEKRMQENSK